MKCGLPGRLESDGSYCVVTVVYSDSFLYPMCPSRRVVSTEWLVDFPIILSTFYSGCGLQQHGRHGTAAGALESSRGSARLIQRGVTTGSLLQSLGDEGLNCKVVQGRSGGVVSHADFPCKSTPCKSSRGG